MHSRTRTIAVCVAALLPVMAAVAQTPPRFAPMAGTRVLVVPAQEAAGVADARAWLARFDSVFTAQLHDGGIAAGWAYPRDAVRYQRQNPSYLTDPRVLGTRPLAAANVKEGMTLPEPFASRIRAYVALADSRAAVVPVTMSVDTTSVPANATLRLVVVDARASNIVAALTLASPFSGGPASAADSLANAAARLFVAGR